MRKFEITEAQLKAIMDLADTISGMLGCGDEHLSKLERTGNWVLLVKDL